MDIDRRLGPEDVRGSIAHVRMLAARGIVTADDAKKIEEGLARIASEIDEGTMAWRDDREDVHMDVEALLTERIGEAGGRLHTGRSTKTGAPERSMPTSCPTSTRSSGARASDDS